jgi:1-acyl-sn-glycerol-3-phosphate acyltransferase
MQTNFFQTIVILIKSLYTVLSMCNKAIYHSWRGTLTPELIDEIFQKHSESVIKYTKARLAIINPNHIAPKPSQATIIMCNHVSLYDIPLTYLAFKGYRVRMLAKKELSKVPFFGRLMKACEIPTIDRHNRHQAIQDLNRVRELLAHGMVMWIAPEGTRSADGKLAKFKKGGFITAIQAQATIIPMVIKGANLILPARSLKFSLNQKVDVIIGQPIDASEYNLEQKEELMALVHNAMDNMLNSSTI